MNNDDDKKMTTQCGNPCDAAGKEHNHSCTSELTQADFTMAA